MIMAASREFVEESLGVVNTCIDKQLNTLHIVHSLLKTGMFWRRIVLQVRHVQRPNRFHATYLLPIEWDPDIPRRFLDTRTRLEYIINLAQEWEHCFPKHLIDENDHIGPVTVHSDGCITCHRTCDAPSILNSPWSRDGPTTSVATFDDKRDAEQLVRWVNLRDRLTRATMTPHSCVHIEYDRVWGLIQRVHVDQAALEKDHVRWWTTTELDEVISGRGQLGMDRFRPYFLPVLQTMLNVIGEHVKRRGAFPGDECTDCEP